MNASYRGTLVDAVCPVCGRQRGVPPGSYVCTGCGEPFEVTNE